VAGKGGEGKGGEGRFPKASSFPKNWGCIEYTLITIFSKQKSKTESRLICTNG